MNWVEHGQRADVVFRRIVALAGQDSGNRGVHRRIRRDPTTQACAHFSQVTVAWVDQIGALLQIARIFRRFAIHEARMGR